MAQVRMFGSTKRLENIVIISIKSIKSISYETLFAEISINILNRSVQMLPILQILLTLPKHIVNNQAA